MQLSNAEIEETLNIPTQDTSPYIYWLNDEEYLEIGFNTETFMNSLIQSAIESGIEEETARTNAEELMIKLFYTPQSPNTSAVYISKVVRDERTNELVEQQFNFLNYNFAQIIGYVMQKAIPADYNPALLTTEAKMLIIQSFLDKTLAHEQEHLVDLMNEDLKNEMLNSGKRTNFVEKAMRIGQIPWFTLFYVIFHTDKIPPEARRPVLITTGNIYLASSFVVKTLNRINFKMLSDHEVRANKAALELPQEYKSPFTIKHYQSNN